jgi:translocation and assembly module TamB
MIRLLLRGLLIVVLIPILLLLAVAGLIQLRPVQDWLTATLSEQLSTPESGIRLAGLEGWIPFDFRLGEVVLTDQDGAWLTLEDVALDWRLSALFGGRIELAEVSAARLEVLRSPAAAPEEAAVEAEPSDEPFRLPELPESLPPVTLDRLAIERIDLGAQLLGEPASFTLEGRLGAADDGTSADLALDLLRVDQETASAALEAAVDLAARTLKLDLDARETGGLMARLSGRPEAGDLHLTLDGEGPIEDWRGRLELAVDNLVESGLDLELALRDEPMVAIAGTVRPAEGLLPVEAAALVAGGVDIDLAVVQPSAQALLIDRLRIEAADLALSAEGEVNFESGALALNADLDAPELATFADLAGQPLQGGLGLNLGLSGTLQEPAGQAELRLDGLSLEQASAESVQTTLRFTPLAPLDSSDAGFDLALDGRTSGLRIAGLDLPEPDLAWRLDARAPLAGAIELRTLTVTNPLLTLDGSGRVDPETLEASADLGLDLPDLQALTRPFGPPIEGRGRIDAAVTSAEGAADLGVDLEAALDGLAGLPPGAKELVGEALRLAARVDLENQQNLRLSALQLTGDGFVLEGEAAADLAAESLSGELALRLPELKKLEPVAGRALAGALALDLDLGGSFSAPEADLLLESDGLALDGEPIRTLKVTASGRELTSSPTGKVSLDLAARGLDARLGTDYRLEGERLRLDEISLTGPETRLAGGLDLDLGTSLASGRLEGRIGKLEAFEPLLGMPLRGALDLAADLTRAQGRQDAVVTLDGSDIAGDFGGLEMVHLDLSVRDALGRLGLVAGLRLGQFRQGDIRLQTASLDVEGDLQALNFETSLEGRALDHPLVLGAKGDLGLDQGTRLRLSALDGRFAEEDIRLAGPAEFRIAGQSTVLDGLDLRIGQASLEGDVEIGPTAIKGGLRLRDLPMAWLDYVDGPALAGSGQVDVTLSGTAAAPRIEASVDLANLVSSEVAGVDLPPVDLALRANLADGRLAADLEARGVTRKPVTARAALPVELSLQPVAFRLPEDGALDGEIDADLELDRVADLLALDEQRLEGDLTARIALGGTLSKPAVEGPVTIDRGHYENGFTGTVLDDITLRLAASEDRITIEQLSASTGKKGRISGEGEVNLGAERMPLSARITLTDARLVRRDDVDATISGRIGVEGDTQDARIVGRLTVDRAEISIPEGGGPNLPTLEVEEIGGTRTPEPPAEEAEASPFEPTLDVTVDLPGRIFVRGRGLDSEWEGKLAITGKASDPALSGNLAVKRGFFDFLDKRFTLEEGLIDFNGSTPPDPVIALTAEAEDNDFIAIIRLEGQATDPKLTLTSEPELPDDEVLARLLFNRELSEIGPTEAAKLALALNRLRGGGGFDAFGEIRDALKIDTLDVVSGEEPDESVVKAGKYLSDDVYVEVEKGTAEESGRARVEVEILPNVAVEADTGEDASGGIGLKWRFDY